MSRVAITGYASLDHVAMLDAVPAPHRTTTILGRPAGAWPRLGGSPAYISAALVGVADAVPISWVGDDEAGSTYRQALTRQGTSDRGLASVAGARTPIAILAYEPAGGCLCLYDPGMPPIAGLTDAQAALVAEAEWVCLTIGPSAVTEAVLERIAPDTRLAWAVKHDPRALSPALAARVAARADLVCHAQGEAAFAGAALAGAPARASRIVIETHGAAGALVRAAGAETAVPATPLQTADPTGAGDTFMGGVLAGLTRGADAVEAARAGIAAAARLLAARGTPSSTPGPERS